MPDEESVSIIDFIRNVWRTYFNHQQAPITLCYDPLSAITGTHYGLAHIAHDSIYMSDMLNYDPDSHIYAIDPYDRNHFPPSANDIEFTDLPKLPNFECIVFVSNNGDLYVEEVMKKLLPGGIAIVIYDCISISTDWQTLEVSTIPEFGRTITFPSSQHKPHREVVRSIKAYRAPS